MAKNRTAEASMSGWRLDLIAHANRILNAERAKGYSLTLRSLHYEFVGNDLYPDKWIVEVTSEAGTFSTKNHQKNYDKLGVLMTEARYAGLVAWHHLKDLTREVSGGAGGWKDPRQVLPTYADYFSIDLWRGQQYRAEVWVEKDAKEDVVGQAASKYQVPYFSMRGIPSSTAVYDAAQRAIRHIDNGYLVKIFLLSDLDPSGWFMLQDVTERLAEIVGEDYADSIEVVRLGLNIEHARSMKLVPNSAKLSDNNAPAFIEMFGPQSWELDAVPSEVIAGWIDKALLGIIDMPAYQARKRKQKLGRQICAQVGERWDEVLEYLGIDAWVTDEEEDNQDEETED